MKGFGSLVGIDKRGGTVVSKYQLFGLPLDLLIVVAVFGLLLLAIAVFGGRRR